jgi:hypothetical protein
MCCCVLELSLSLRPLRKQKNARIVSNRQGTMGCIDLAIHGNSPLTWITAVSDKIQVRFRWFDDYYQGRRAGALLFMCECQMLPPQVPTTISYHHRFRYGTHQAFAAGYGSSRRVVAGKRGRERKRVNSGGNFLYPSGTAQSVTGSRVTVPPIDLLSLILSSQHVNQEAQAGSCRKRCATQSHGDPHTPHQAVVCKELIPLPWTAISIVLVFVSTLSAMQAMQDPCVAGACLQGQQVTGIVNQGRHAYFQQ